MPLLPDPTVLRHGNFWIPSRFSSLVSGVVAWGKLNQACAAKPQGWTRSSRVKIPQTRPEIFAIKQTRAGFKPAGAWLSWICLEGIWKDIEAKSTGLSIQPGEGRRAGEMLVICGYCKTWHLFIERGQLRDFWSNGNRQGIGISNRSSQWSCASGCNTMVGWGSGFTAPVPVLTLWQNAETVMRGMSHPVQNCFMPCDRTMPVATYLLVRQTWILMAMATSWHSLNRSSTAASHWLLT